MLVCPSLVSSLHSASRGGYHRRRRRLLDSSLSLYTTHRASRAAYDNLPRSLPSLLPALPPLTPSQSGNARIPPAAIMMIYFGGKNCARERRAMSNVPMRASPTSAFCVSAALAHVHTHTYTWEPLLFSLASVMNSIEPSEGSCVWPPSPDNGASERAREKEIHPYIYLSRTRARDLTRRDLSCRAAAYILNFEKKFVRKRI